MGEIPVTSYCFRVGAVELAILHFRLLIIILDIESCNDAEGIMLQASALTPTIPDGVICSD